VSYVYTKSIKFFPTQRELKGYRGKALIDDNGYFLIKINNAAYMPFKLTLRELISKLITAQN
jgi:hypothetical protein